MNLNEKVTALKAQLGVIEREHAPAALASSFGAEDMVLTHLIAGAFRKIEIFTFDTGRLPPETVALMHRTSARYDLDLRVFRPQASAVRAYVDNYGPDAFYDSVLLRKACCAVRKVEPLQRALSGRRAWLTGLRREQAASRQNLASVEVDAVRGLTKFNPLLNWSSEDVWAFLRLHDVPYNSLHDSGYPSIGCAPCTRAVLPGEDPRAGRWWWEKESGQQECGLHVSSGILAKIPVKVTV